MGEYESEGDAPPDSKRQRQEEGASIELKAPVAGNGVYVGTNGMPRAGGRVLHLGLANGELANRCVVVGTPDRAALLAEFLEPEEPGGSVFRLASDRGFITYTGKFMGVRVSVVSIGMGLPMMDFFTREGREVVEGPMAAVRFGTCGCVQESVPAGSIAVATEGSVLVQRNYTAFAAGDGDAVEDYENGHAPYNISDVCQPDAELSAAVHKALKGANCGLDVVSGLNVTSDSFYGSQGRTDPHFSDASTKLLDEILRRHCKAVTMEMETFQLLHLARSCLPRGHFRAAAAVVVVANRITGAVVNADKLKVAERNGGQAILRALAGLAL